MIRISRRLVDTTARMLEPDERDAVLGDFAESGEAGGRALRGLLGLVLRRQAVLWKDWRPWLVLVSLLVPLAWLLSIACRITAGLCAVYLWSYLNNWDWALLRYASFWYILRDAVIAFSVPCIILICWSWSAGFLLGSASRRIMPVNSILFCLALVLGGLLGAPLYIASWFPARPLSADPNGPVFALSFYRLIFPPILEAILVAVPAIWAMRSGARLKRLPKSLRTVLLIGATLAIVGMTIQQPGLGFFFRAHRQLAFLHGWPREFLYVLVYWPIVYLLVGTIVHRWQRRAAHESLVHTTGDN